MKNNDRNMLERYPMAATFGLIVISGIVAAVITANLSGIGGAVGQGLRQALGVAISDLTPDEAKAIGTFQTKGAVIRRVEDNSPAARAGLQPEDVVTAINDQPVADRASLQNPIGSSVPGQTIALLVEKANHRGPLQLVRVEVGAATGSP